MSERVEEARGEMDEGGFFLYIGTDEGEHQFRVTSTTEAREILRAVAPLLAWVADEDRERAAYDRASPEERERITGVTLDDIDRRLDRAIQAADDRRKRERENPS